MSKAAHGWRVVYGETRPAWERIFPTRREARTFKRKQLAVGDRIFSCRKVVPGEPPQSMTAAIAAAEQDAPKNAKNKPARGITLPQQRVLARFRRGPIQWTGKLWRARDLHTVSYSIMERLKELKLIRYHEGVEKYGTQSRAVASLTKSGEAALAKIPAFCRACGCTDAQACDGGCWWVEPDLCSSCVDGKSA